MIFCMHIKINLSYSLILLILVGMPRWNAQIPQINKFVKYMWYLKKEFGNEVEFLSR